MSDLETQVKITAKNETRGTFNQVSSDLKGLGSDASGLAKVLGGVAVAGLAGMTAFLYKAAEGAGQMQVAVAKVDATLKSMGEAALKNRDALFAASQGAIKLGFDDEAAAVSIAKLYQRTGDLTEATKLNNLAMDLARAKSIDLESASTAIGMVLSGNTKVLKQFGIEVDETLTPMQQLEQLQGKIAGQGEAFAATFPGQMQILNESWQNLTDTVGLSLLEAINPFIKNLTTWANDPKTQAQIKGIATELGEFAKVVIPIAIGAIENLWAVFKKVYDVLVSIGTAILDTIGWLDKMFAKWDKFIGVSKTAGVSTASFNTSAMGYSSLNPSSNYGIPSFDVGGVVPGAMGAPMLATVHGGETIIPNGSRGGVGTTVNVINPVLLDDTMISQVSIQIARLLKQDFRY